MEFLQLKYFITAAENESFTAAARAYDVPTSDISQTIKRLERELGTELFVRSANSVRLSQQGSVFLEGARKAMAALGETVTELKEMKEGIFGEIKLLVLTNRRGVTEAIEAFRSTYPDVSFRISHTYREGDEFDIAISDESPKKGSFESVPLITERILLAHKSYSLPMKGKTADLASLSLERFITMPEPSSHFRITRHICREHGFEPNIGIICDDPYYIRKYVELGLGAAFVPEFSWLGQFSEGTRLYDIGNIYRTTHMYISKSSRNLRSCIMMAEQLKEVFGRAYSDSVSKKQK